MTRARQEPRLAALLLAGFATAAAVPAAAADYWFRADPTGAGCPTADGRSYATAWCRDDTSTAPGSIRWADIPPGSTLYVCGVHDRGWGDRHLQPTVDGITLDGNCGSVAGPGFIIAGQKFAATVTGNPDTGWAPYPASGTRYGFYRTYSGSSQVQALEDADNNPANGFTGLSRLGRQAGPPDATWPCGAFYQSGTTFYYRPTDCSTTAPDTVYAHGTDPVVIADRANVTVRNLTIVNADRGISITRSRNTQVVRNVMRWISSMAIRVEGNADHGTVQDNDLSDVANGLILLSPYWNTADNNDYWLVVGNRIYNVDQESYYNLSGATTGDSHAIGVQGGSWNEIAFNELHHVADSAITFYNDYAQEQSNNRIHHNFVHDVVDLSSRDRNERGIEYGHGNHDIDPSRTQNNVVTYNVLRNVDKAALRTKSAWWSGQECAPGECTVSWSFTHNTIYRAGTSFEWAYTTGQAPEFVFEGNISSRPAGSHLYTAAFDRAVNHGRIVVGRNVLYPDGARFWWGSPLQVYPSLASWSAASGLCRSSAGTLNCPTSAPLFLATNSGAFHWQYYPYTIPGGGDFSLGAGSPALDIAATGDYDLDGASVYGRQFDAGAYERH